MEALDASSLFLTYDLLVEGSITGERERTNLVVSTGRLYMCAGDVLPVPMHKLLYFIRTHGTARMLRANLKPAHLKVEGFSADFTCIYSYNYSGATLYRYHNQEYNAR